MRLNWTRIRDIGPFTEEVLVDWRAGLENESRPENEIIPPIVSLCGENGEGKSTLLNMAMLGAVYRNTMGQGTPQGRANGRSSLLESNITHLGKSYTFKHLLDAVSGKGTAVVFLDDSDGTLPSESVGAEGSLTGSTKVSVFDKWVKENMPKEDPYRAAMFGGQKSGGFLKATAGDRKAILLRALGLSHWEKKAKLAREKAAAVEVLLVTTRARLSDARATGGDVKALAFELDERLGGANGAEAALRGADTQLAAVEQAAQEARTALTARETHLEKQATMSARVKGAAEKIADAQARIDAAEKVLIDEAKIREAVEHHKTTTTNIEGLKVRRRQLDHEIFGYKLTTAETAATGAQSTLSEADTLLASAEESAREAEIALTARKTHLEKRATSAARVESIDAKIVDTQKRIDAADKVLGDETKIREAAARCEADAKELTELETQCRERKHEISGAGLKVSDHERRAQAANEQVAQAERGISEASRIIEQTAAIQEAVTQRQTLERTLTERKQALTQLQAGLDSINAVAVAGADDRADTLRAGLVRVGAAYHLDDAHSHAAKSIDGDDAEIEQRKNLPGKRTARLEARDAGAKAITETETAIAKISALADRAAELDTESKAIDTLERVKGSQLQLAEEQRELANRAAKEGEAHQTSLDAAQANHATLSAQLAALKPLAEQLPNIELAAKMVVERREQLTTLKIEHAAATEELTVLGLAPEALPATDTAPARETARLAQAEMLRTRDAATAAKSTLASATEALGSDIENEAAGSPELAKESLDAARSELTTLADQLITFKALADQLPNIELAAKMVVERREQLTTLKIEHATATEELTALGLAPEAPPVKDTAQAHASVRAARISQLRARDAVTLAKSTLESATKAQHLIDDLGGEQTEQEAELADWKRLADTCGRKGIQAAEIDGIGPTLTAHVNDLLLTCHGPRYSVRIDTQRLAGDGKTLIEGCAVTVFDGERGREDEGANFSGGESVPLEEAISAGIGLICCSRGNLENPTIARDETGDGSSEKNAPIYQKMLKRAAKLLDADRVILISHRKEIESMADTRLVVADGRVTVDNAAMAVAA